MSDTTPPLPAPPRPIPWWRIALFGLLAGIVVAVCVLGPDANTPSQSGVTMQLPLRLGDFWGYEQEVSLAEKTILPGDTEFARKVYESTRGDSINCQVVLQGGQKNSIHQPEVCLQGQGWEIPSGQVVPVKLDSGKILRVMKLNLKREVELTNGEKKIIHTDFLYWFVGKDTTTPYHRDRVLRTAMDRVFHNINHRWAYVIVSAPVTADYDPRGKNDEETMAMLKDFIRGVVPHLDIAEAISAGA